MSHIINNIQKPGVPGSGTSLACVPRVFAVISKKVRYLGLQSRLQMAVQSKQLGNTKY